MSIKTIHNRRNRGNPVYKNTFVRQVVQTTTRRTLLLLWLLKHWKVSVFFFFYHLFVFGQTKLNIIYYNNNIDIIFHLFLNSNLVELMILFIRYGGIEKTFFVNFVIIILYYDLVFLRLFLICIVEIFRLQRSEWKWKHKQKYELSNL